jgi:hypothetical protein
MSALCQKRTLRRVLDMIDIVLRKVLKLWGRHYETSPQTVFASGRERCRTSGLAAYRERTNLSNAAGACARWFCTGRCKPEASIAFSIAPASWIGIAIDWMAKVGPAASIERKNVPA